MLKLRVAILAGAVVCGGECGLLYGADSAAERDWLPLEDVRIGGELRERIVRSMERLEGAEYKPDQVFEASSTWPEWPGDYAGRTILAHVLEARARLSAGEVSFAEETDAPFGGTTRVKILSNTAGEVAFRVRSAPPQRGRWKAGEVITFTEEVKVDYAVPPIRPENAAGKVRRFRGVLMYGECGGSEVPVYDLLEHSAATDPRNLPFGLPYDRVAIKVLFDAK